MNLKITLAAIVDELINVRRALIPFDQNRKYNTEYDYEYICSKFLQQKARHAFAIQVTSQHSIREPGARLLKSHGRPEFASSLWLPTGHGHAATPELSFVKTNSSVSLFMAFPLIYGTLTGQRA